MAKIKMYTATHQGKTVRVTVPERESDDMAAIILKIARRDLGIETLDERKSDRLDFHELAVWEIKEYYYTTTFGSRVADGVYETLLDGMEIEELASAENVNVLHYLMIDAHGTWWNDGKSYLCRIVDMLHMGYVDEVLVGREIITRLPMLVKEWVKKMPKKR